MSRVDMSILLPRIKGSKFEAPFQAIAELEQYTLLTPPYEEEGVRYYAKRVQKELGVKMLNDFYLFLKCCDGGLLFTNVLYSVYTPDDENVDLVERNRFLRDEGLVPENCLAIGETNYGAYIILHDDGTDGTFLWDPQEEENPQIATFPCFVDWLNDTVKEARYLLKDHSLPVIVDPEENEDE